MYGWNRWSHNGLGPAPNRPRCVARASLLRAYSPRPRPDENLQKHTARVPIRLVICDYSGHPFQVELSRALASRGHDVLHPHFAGFQTPKGKLNRLPEDPPSFRIEGLSLAQTFDKSALLQRRFLEAKVGALAAARVVGFCPDVVIGCNMPLDAQRKLQRCCAINRIAFVYWVQDLYSSAISHYMGTRLGFIGRVIGRHYQRIEGAMLRASDAVVAISQKFVDPLERSGVRRDRIRVIPNWAPLSDIVPAPKDNQWARRYALNDKLIALYTGTLGLKHNPALLRDLARQCISGGLHVVVVSEGPAMSWLAREKAAHGISNLTLLPFQPMERYPEVLGTGDILLAMIEKEAGGFSVPSKVLSYIAAGKPIVASIASDNDAALVISAAQAGVVVNPGEDREFCRAVMRLADDAALRQEFGRNARIFAETIFAIEPIADQFEEIFRPLARLSRGPVSPRRGVMRSIKPLLERNRGDYSHSQRRLRRPFSNGRTMLLKQVVAISIPGFLAWAVIFMLLIQLLERFGGGK